MTRSSFLMEWDAPEHEHKERNSDWFWAVGILAVSIAIAAAIFNNLIFGIFILIAAFALCLYVNRDAFIIHVLINEKGIAKNKTFYPFHTLRSFWIDVDHPHKKILLRSEKTLVPLIVIPLADDMDPEKIHTELTQFIPEEFHELPFVERMLEYLGF